MKDMTNYILPITLMYLVYVEKSYHLNAKFSIYQNNLTAVLFHQKEKLVQNLSQYFSRSQS